MYHKPGFEYGEKAGTKGGSGRFTNHDMSVIAPWLHNKYLNASPCVLPDKERMGELSHKENENIWAHLNTFLTEGFINSPVSFYTCNHFKEHRFRQDSGTDENKYYYDPFSMRIMCKLKDDKGENWSRPLAFKSVEGTGVRHDGTAQLWYGTGRLFMEQVAKDVYEKKKSTESNILDADDADRHKFFSDYFHLKSPYLTNRSKKLDCYTFFTDFLGYKIDEPTQ